MTTQLTPVGSRMMEKVLVQGDLSSLSSEQRLALYKRTCESMGLNPFSRPFEYLKIDGKLILYATRSATEQLRSIHGISITALESRYDEALGIYSVIAHAVDATGRTDVATGAVSLPATMKGDARANALLRCETKAKRRVTLSLAGLGWLEESELHTVPHAEIVPDDDLTPALPEDVVHVESETYPGTVYRVDLAARTCDCPDFVFRGGPCKHLEAAEAESRLTPLTDARDAAETEELSQQEKETDALLGGDYQVCPNCGLMQEGAPFVCEADGEQSVAYTP